MSFQFHYFQEREKSLLFFFNATVLFGVLRANFPSFDVPINVTTTEGTILKK